MSDDPFALFDAWYAEAKAAEINDPDAMALATVDLDGRPAVRMVLLKGHGPDGFAFFTNAESRKGNELAANPNAALLFHWKSLRRQVRVEGPVKEVGLEEADAYFATPSQGFADRCLGLGPVSPARSRETFEMRCEDVRTRFEGGEVPRPPRWTGFRVTPQVMEFWSDRPHRLHERRLFSRRPDGSWTEGLLYP